VIHFDTARRFIAFAADTGALKFGEFQTKSGRKSPYFFNAGALNSGHKLWCLTEFYCEAIANSGINFDMFYGPSYKGIPLAVATDIPLQGRIMAIVDVYDALVSERPYKKAFTHEEAVKIIMDGAGTQFDPEIAKLFYENKDQFQEVKS